MSLSYAKREELFDKFRKTRQPGKEFTEQIDGFAATAAVQAKNSQVNTGLSVCTV